MADPFLGQLTMFCGSYAPEGWAFCDGSIIPIQSNEPLYSLLGTTFGGDGQTTFGLPDLRGRVPVHRSGTMPPGQTGGEESVTLTSGQIGAHSHSFNGTQSLATDRAPGLNVVAQGTSAQLFVEDVLDQQLNPGAILPAKGGSEPHENMVPFQAVNYIIATQGQFPPQG